MVEKAFSQLVVMGSSAGGVEALSQLVSTLPPDFPAPIVVAQHLDPDRESHLGDILSRRSTLPVRTLTDYEHLEAGVVFVVPSNYDVEITDHDIRLQSGGTRRSKPSIDLLFASAAQIFQERLIAVILTGTGSDGAAGAHEVQRHNGTVVIQDPATASHPALPRSLAPNTVDIVASIEEMGKVLHSLLTGTDLPAAVDDEAPLRTLLAQLRDQHGIDFAAYKRPTVLRRVRRRMVATGSSSIADYVEYVQLHPQEQLTLIAALLIKVTEFFRDAELFSALRDGILPDLIDTARKSERKLRFWSAGCATGEEAYSLAIALAEALGDELELFNIRIFATDLDTDAITFARQGVYSSSTVSGVDPGILEKYFDQVDTHYQVKKRIRALMVFGQHNLGDRAPFPRIDLLLCRNVLIYFTSELQRQILQLFAFALRDNGYLVLGKSETTTPFTEPFRREDPHLKIFRRRSNLSPIPLAMTRAFAPASAIRATPTRPSLFGSDLSAPPAKRSRSQPVRERADRLLLDLSLGVVVVDRRYDIQYINEAARTLLGIRTGALGDDLVHLTQALSPTELRAGIDAVFREGERTSFVAESKERGVEISRHVEITCYGETTDGPAIETVTIIVSDVTESVEHRQELERLRASNVEEKERLSGRVNDLTSANRDLLQANQQLTRECAELRGQNEEYLMGNEELQAASEEIETLNEELQATNEELETLNEELQATVEELDTTNDDLQAQSAELQNLAVRLEGERARLEAVLSSMEDAVLVANAGGEVSMTNSAYDRLFPDTEEPVTIQDDQGNRLSTDERPEQRVLRGETFRMTFQTEVDGATRSFEAIGQPLPVSDEGGGMLVVREIMREGDGQGQ